MTLARSTGRLASLALISGLLVTTGAGTAYAADPVDGAQTLGDSLFPNQGNGGYDAQHYDIDLAVDVAISGTNNAASTTTFREATTTMEAVTTGAPLRSYSLDFQGSRTTLSEATLNVDSVTVDGEPATFTRIENTSNTSAVADNHKLIVTPASPVDGEFTTVVTYSGRPVAHTDPDASSEGWNNTTDGATFVNQPVGAMTAFPHNNTPRDKATYDISIDIPTKLRTSATAASANPGLKDAAAVSNGELVSRTPSEDGSRTTWVWKQSEQMASMLSLISIGRYDMYTSDITLASGRTIPEWTFIDPAISASNQNTTQASRAQAKQIIDFLETKYGPYPGNSTGFVTDVVPSSINYALETQDRSFFPNAASRSTTIHEITHQWWGNNVTPADWNDIWISEGNATFTEGTTAFESSGTSTTPVESSYFSSFTASNPSSSLWSTPPAAMTNGAQLFGAQVYTRGSWALEALRISIGTTAYEEVMRQWQDRNGGTSKRTTDFIALAEEISGRDLTAFFQQWVYSTSKGVWPSKFDLTLTGPAAPVLAGDTTAFTLDSRNTGRVVQTGSVVTLDLADVLDDAILGTLPTGTAVDGNTLTWTVPSTAVGAISTVSIPVTVASDATGATLAATARASTLGSTCVACTSSVVVGSQPISPSADPTIGGSPVVGQTLTAGTGGWASGTTFTYRWLIGGASVPGATSATYRPDAFAVGLPVTVRVTGTKGSLNATRTSAATAAVTRATQTAPAPTITGTPQFGKRLTAVVGAHEPGTYFTYQWSANGVLVSAANGGTGPTFVPAVASQLGQNITVTVTATKAGYSNLAQTSGPAGPVAAGVFDSTPTPTLNGAPKVGAAVAAVPGQWDDGTAFTYQWLLDGSPIAGATAASYTPTGAQLGGNLSVTVTGVKAGYPSTARTSDTASVAIGTQVLTPTPTITGSARAESPLTGVPGTWDTGTALTYQWSVDGEPVEDATTTTFTPTRAQIGSDVTFAVTSTRAGYTTVTRTSAATTVKALAQTLTPTPTVSGTPKVGQELTGDPGTWDEGTTLTYAWLADDEVVTGADGLTFTPGAAEAGAAITFRVTSTLEDFETATATSAATDPVAEGTFDPTPVPTITGTPQVGEELTAEPGEWDERAQLSYQWLADGEEIEGATASAYTPTAGTIGAAISVEVTGSRDGYESVTRTSDETAPVVIGELTDTPDPTIAGTPKVGEALTAETGDWDAGTTFTYQWLVANAPVEDATDATYTPTPEQAGDRVTVKVTGTKDGYTPVTRTSEATERIAVGNLEDAPTPTISGTPQVGEELTAEPGDWAEGTTFTYQWSFQLDEETEVSVFGASDDTYTPTGALAGKTVRVRVTGTQPGFAPVTRVSAFTEPVAEGDLDPTPAPTVTGTPMVGETLTAVPGTWDEYALLSYQWFAGGVPVSGATGLTFSPGAAEVGDAITVAVTGTRSGYTPVTRTSEPTAVVAAGTFTLTPVPTTTGTAQVGKTVTAVPGTWDAGTTFTYQWQRGGRSIPGATKASYTATYLDRGLSLTVRVTGSKPGFTSVTRASVGARVTSGVQVRRPVPSISGTPKVGRTLTARSATYDAGVKLEYIWYAGGKAVGGNTRTLKMSSSYVGKTIVLKVLARKTGYLTVITSSKPTAKVTR